MVFHHLPDGHRFRVVANYLAGAWLLGILALMLPLQGCLGLSFLLSGLRGGSGDAVEPGTRTFTAPVEYVRQDALEALQTMGFPVDKMELTVTGWSLQASSAAPGRPLEIAIELEPLSAQATRMRVVAKRGVFQKDAATAAEIIRQTVTIRERQAGTAPPLSGQITSPIPQSETKAR